MVPGSPTSREVAGEATAVKAIKDFVRQNTKLVEQLSSASGEVPVQVPLTFEGLDSRLRPEVVEETRR